MLFSMFAVGCDTPETTQEASTLELYYSLDETTGSLAKESVTNTNYTINYVFNQSNAALIALRFAGSLMYAHFAT